MGSANKNVFGNQGSCIHIATRRVKPFPFIDHMTFSHTLSSVELSWHQSLDQMLFILRSNVQKYRLSVYLRHGFGVTMYGWQYYREGHVQWLLFVSAGVRSGYYQDIIRQDKGAIGKASGLVDDTTVPLSDCQMPRLSPRQHTVHGELHQSKRQILLQSAPSN